MCVYIYRESLSPCLVFHGCLDKHKLGMIVNRKKCKRNALEESFWAAGQPLCCERCVRVFTIAAKKVTVFLGNSEKI